MLELAQVRIPAHAFTLTLGLLSTHPNTGGQMRLALMVVIGLLSASTLYSQQQFLGSGLVQLEQDRDFKGPRVTVAKKAVQADSDQVSPNVRAVLDRVDAAAIGLAAKFNVAAPQIWNILKRQAAVEFYVSIGAVLIGLLLFFLGLFALTRLSRRSDDVFEVVGVIAMGVGGFTSIVGLVASVITLPGYLNPDYYALSKLLNL